VFLAEEGEEGGITPLPIRLCKLYTGG